MMPTSADFYGPRTEHGVPNVLVFEPFAKGTTASWLVNASVPHSTFTPDAARGVAMLAERESAWNQVWHLPTAPNPPTGKEIIEMAAAAFGVAPKYRVLSRPLLRVAGLFNPPVRESYEMLYQSRTLSIQLDEVHQRVRICENALLRRYPDYRRLVSGNPDSGRPINSTL